MAGEGVGNSQPALAVPTASGKHIVMGTLLPACHSCLSPCAVPREQRGQGASSPPSMQSVPQTEMSKQPQKRDQEAAAAPGWGHAGTRPPADGNQWLLIPQDTARLSRPGHGALTRALVLDEEELQPLLEGVFVHVELDLHPAGETPEGPVSGWGGVGWGGRAEQEPPRSPPVPPSQRGDPTVTPGSAVPQSQSSSSSSREPQGPPKLQM